MENKTDKKLYYQFSDGFDVSKIVLDLTGIMEWIESDMEQWSEGDEMPEYKIEPIWLTDEEFENLPEAEI